MYAACSMCVQALMMCVQRCHTRAHLLSVRHSLTSFKGLLRRLRLMSHACQRLSMRCHNGVFEPHSTLRKTQQPARQSDFVVRPAAAGYQSLGPIEKYRMFFLTSAREGLARGKPGL